MYKRREEFEDGRMEMKEVVQRPFDAQWVYLQPSDPMEWEPAWNLLVTPLPWAIGEGADPCPQAFPYDRVMDMGELISVVNLINALVSISFFSPAGVCDPLSSLLCMVHYQSKSGWAPYERESHNHMWTAYDISRAMEFLAQDMLNLKRKGSLVYPELKAGINLKEQEVMFRIVFGYSHKDVKNVVDEQRETAIFDF